MFNLSSGGGHLGFPIDKKKQKLFYPYHGKISSYMQLQRRRFQKFMQVTICACLSKVLDAMKQTIVM
jgi:hypothetical protein